LSPTYRADIFEQTKAVAFGKHSTLGEQMSKPNDRQIDAWIVIAQSHRFGWMITADGTFELAVEWSNDAGDIGIHWERIESTRQLLIAMGY
jgi:hypothetical protein